MGISLFSSCGCYEGRKAPPEAKAPDPKKYTIECLRTIGEWVIVLASYPGCTNFEGRKIMVYHGIPAHTVVSQLELDPHFSDKERAVAPVARFRPDGLGWSLAVSMCERTKIQ